MTHSKTFVGKMIFHFDTPFGGTDNSIPEDVAKDIESFRSTCKGKVGFSNSSTYDRKRLEVSCEENPVLTENDDNLR